MENCGYNGDRGGELIVAIKNRDWQSLAAKVERGVTLEEALEQTGVTLEELEAHLDRRGESRKTDDALLHLTAHYAIAVGVKTLTKIALAGPRYATAEREGNAVRTETPLSTDLDAAKALVSFGIKVKSMVKPAKSAEGAKASANQPDLWDVAALGPWKALKNPAEQC